LQKGKALVNSFDENNTLKYLNIQCNGLVGLEEDKASVDALRKNAILISFDEDNYL
ncbi:17080_t:CDS:1, partial [Dentiscutata heterogama]